ncbi:DUF4912 domain-containing protein [Bythopirellula polymerisocia]|uniref:Rho termination factor-like N-terminal domain-containing protein n=1 Tax=Bythopirellula polymerisocia TaxID=2528003 RepID=A0A5C6CV16_9BACT|nr:DUF4912 domain-containing protein [Bythopirellula polymerisocia]TWU27347.1 hypothetical protein Pla144_21190 [Bythopirellula polymerisocia]
MTAASLRSHTAKDLAQIARQQGVPGWHSMRKADLIKALIHVAQKKTSTRQQQNGNGHSGSSTTRISETPPQVRQDIQAAQQKLALLKNLALKDSGTENSDSDRDQLIVMVRDPYWLHANWSLSQRSIDRAQAALGQRWHHCQPTLRVFRIMEAGSSVLVRDITIHGGVSNWYVDVAEPPSQFRMEIGYLAEDGTFYALARSNSVQTPSADANETVDENWSDVAENADRIFAMSGGYSQQGTSRELQELLETRLHRPMGSPMNTRFGHGAALDSVSALELAVDADVTIYGVTSRSAHVTLKGVPINVRPDGTFSAKLKLAEQRQVIPIVASACDGVEQRTVILALDRNTKVMEPLFRDISKPS